jgi:hypothetical protein
MERTDFSMETMTFEEVREAPEKIAPMLEKGHTVRITKDGKPFFDAVPSRSGLREFFTRVDQVWSGSPVSRSTVELLSGLRESRE